MKRVLITGVTVQDETPRKLLDISVLESLGWGSSITLEDGIEMVYNDTFL